jgi:Protein of unknown function (DUF1292).
MSEDFGADILTVTDEDGQEHSFEVLDTVEYNDEQYFAVVPVGESEEEALQEDLNLVIMKITEEDGEEFLDIVDDDEEFYNIGEIFAQRLSDMYDVEIEE